MNIGIDIVANSRISLEKDFQIRVLHVEEIEKFKELKLNSEKVNFLAGRWAAKEAIFKTGYFRNAFSMNSICIVIKNNQLRVKGHNKLKVSISHEKEYTVANALAV